MQTRDELISLFGDKKYTFENNIHVLFMESRNLINDMRLLRDQLNFNLLLDICGVDNSQRETEEDNKQFEVVYHLLNMRSHQRLRVRVPVEDTEEVPSLISVWNCADAFEREVWDMYGIPFIGRPNDRILTQDNFVGHPLRKDFELSSDLEEASIKLTPQYEESVIVGRPRLKHWVNISTKHPANFGLLNTMVEVKAELITDAKVDVGYLHRGIEKLVESKNYSDISKFTDRLNYNSAPMNSVGWARAVEELINIEIPDRAKAMRMVISEFSRIMDHLLCIAYQAKEVGSESSYRICIQERETLHKLFLELGNSRQGFDFIQIGGLSHTVPVGWINSAMNAVASISKCLTILDGFLTRTQGWLRRTKVASISAREAVSWGYTGPCLRASGVNYDIRKVTPYYFYEDVDFEIPLGVNGESYDRYLVRMEEIRQSIAIIGQVLDHLPTGEIINPEALSKLNNPIKGEVYSSTEAANGELGFYLISDGKESPYRLKVRAPSFSIYQSLPEIIKGNELMDATVALSSLNIVAGELDR